MMNFEEIKSKAPIGSTHYDKYGNYYMNFRSEWYIWDSEFVLMSHSPLYVVKSL